MSAVSLLEQEVLEENDAVYSDDDLLSDVLLSQLPVNDTDGDSPADASPIPSGKHCRSMSLEEETRLVGMARQGDQAARDALVQGAMGIVHFLANHYRSSFLSREDVIQEGYLGLLHAVDTFKTDMSCRFTYYAQWWVRSAMQRSLIHAHFIRMPDYLAKQVHAVAARGENVQKDGKMSGELKRAIAGFDPFVVSLDRPANSDDGDDCSIDPEDKHTPGPYHAMDRRDVQSLLRLYVDRLPFKQRQVLSMRFGLYGRAEMTLEEIGSFTDKSRESVRQMQNRGLCTLRNLMAADRIFMDDVL